MDGLRSALIRRINFWTDVSTIGVKIMLYLADISIVFVVIIVWII